MRLPIAAKVVLALATVLIFTPFLGPVRGLLHIALIIAYSLHARSQPSLMSGGWATWALLIWFSGGVVMPIYYALYVVRTDAVRLPSLPSPPRTSRSPQPPSRKSLFSPFAGLLASFPIALVLLGVAGIWSILIWAMLLVRELHTQHAAPATILGLALGIVVLALVFVSLVRQPRSQTVSSIFAELIIVALVGALCVWLYEPDLEAYTSPILSTPITLLLFAIAAQAANSWLINWLVGFNRPLLAIAFFRSFGVELSPSEKQRVIPSLGAYGTLQILVDESLTLFPKRPFLGYDEASVFNPSHVVRSTAANWESRAITLVESADVVVIDISSQRRNVVWEAEQTALRKNLSDVLFVCHHDLSAADESLALAKFLQPFSAHPSTSGTSAMPRPIRYGRLSVAFRLQLFLWMLRRSVTLQKLGRPGPSVGRAPG